MDELFLLHQAVSLSAAAAEGLLRFSIDARVNWCVEALQGKCFETAASVNITSWERTIKFSTFKTPKKIRRIFKPFLTGQKYFTRKRVEKMAGMIRNNTINDTDLPKDFRITLLLLYSFIFIFGTLNVLLMSFMLKSQSLLSFTKVSVINLIAVHSIFLLTVPFRIYYYAFDKAWILGMYFCKFVSLMVHAHMYLAFIFYVFLLIVRYVEHSGQHHRLKFHRILHAMIASAVVWFVIFASLLPPTMLKYGTMQNDSTHCFHFGSSLLEPAVKRLNYVICILAILIWNVLAFVQVYFLLYVSKTFGKAKYQRQEFWAQLKNVFFLSIMFFCFVPYQGFRLYYVSEYGNTEKMIYINEVFLAVTAFSCFDMMVFAGRDICKIINSRG
ncbi:probable G-protein coupled receptor 141 [Pseudorasbora parva]|uniref:probable G-protein coupled receptor 141 n=1 Tax=Pseudorasbora parva TaxID=51549 RepID=UPI00351EA6F2